MQGKVAVTISRKEDASSWQLAREIAAQLGTTPVARAGKSWSQICREQEAGAVLICQGDQVVFRGPEGEFAFHLGTAPLRIRQWRRGGREPLVEVMGLGSGDSVLDCTLGLGADAAVCSYVAGSDGKVLGLESSPVLAVMTQVGMRNYRDSDAALQAAVRRILVQERDHRDFLPQLPAASFDIVYFDPMFRRQVDGSSSLRLLEQAADQRPLAPEVVQEARRVARRRVVLKERRESPEFERLGFARREETSGRVAYGIIELD